MPNKPDIGNWRKPAIRQLNPDDFVRQDPLELKERLEKGENAAPDALTIPLRVTQSVPLPDQAKSARTQANFRLPLDLYSRLKTISRLTEQPMNDIVSEALQEYLPKLIKKLPTELRV